VHAQLVQRLDERLKHRQVQGVHLAMGHPQHHDAAAGLPLDHHGNLAAVLVACRA
jgi:hypothetical protein